MTGEGGAPPGIYRRLFLEVSLLRLPARIGDNMRKAALLLLLFLPCLWAGAAPAFTPNDPLNQGQWNFGAIGMGDAWDLNHGGRKDVCLAVVDTGVAYDSYDFMETDFVPGYDFWNNDGDPYDDNGHGSMIAGIMAQSTNNGLGASGIAFNCSIMPVKVFDENGGTGAVVSTHTAVQGIDYAVAHGADIINLSMLLPWTWELEEACARAYQAGVLLVSAAGNDSRGDDARQDAGFPARFSTTLVVANMKEDYTLSYSSQLPVDVRGYGVTAPGSNITQFVPYPYLVGDYTLLPEGVTASGTSLAAPHVTATAGLILSEAYDLGLALPAKGPERVEWLRDVITTTTLDLGDPGPDSTYGHGLVRAENALRYLQTLK